MSLLFSKARKRGVIILACLASLALVLGPDTQIPPRLAYALDASDAFEGAEARERRQHLVGLGVPRWHEAGYRGRGVKVAILDSGFRGYRSFLGRGLPEQLRVRSFRRDGNLEARDSQHGILCGEVVHALAPEAELLFANWEPDCPEQFLEAVRWARREGARIVSCSVIMPSWSDGEGGGGVHAELGRILGGRQAGDLLCFAAAGNTAQRHWYGDFQDGGDGFHQWTRGRTSNRLAPWGAERVSVEMCWKPGSDYQLYVYERESAAVVARSVAKPGEERHSAVARFEPRPQCTYEVRVRLAGGKAVPFHCSALHSGLDCWSEAGSVCFPADGAEVIAVGAVDADGQRRSYSACGPNSRQPKPDLMAPVPFGCPSRRGPFGGTSAAAPQAAALAALWWSCHPDWTAERIRAALRSSARDLAAPGHDFETGYGVIHLPELTRSTQR